MKKIFFNINMSWIRVIILAVVCAFFAATMLIIPATLKTSLSAPGTTFEFWIFVSLIIIMNCKKPFEAGIKTFVFFLISQPLIYLIQVPFSYLGWQLFMFYPRWFIFTLLTLPGGMIAWYIKKDNLISGFILSVATLLLNYMGIYYISYVISRFPYYLLAMLFSFCLAFTLEFVLLKNKKSRLLCLALTFCSLVVLLYINFF